MSAADFQSAGTRPAAVAGSWYPNDPGHLSSQVEVMMEAAGRWTRCARLRALVVPHAALRYSGPTAAYAYVALQPFNHRRVVVLAPNHRDFVRGAVIDPSSHYECPLGSMPVDLEAVEALAHHSSFTCTPKPFQREHAIEMQLPFLAHRLPHARLVPILVGEATDDDFDDIASAVTSLLDDETLLVVSSDFMHYGDAFDYVPFEERIPERIREYDAAAIDAITRGSFPEFASVLQRTGNTICGRRPLGVLLRLMPRAWKGELRFYTNTGELLGDWSHSVSYAALAFCEGDNEGQQLAAEAEMMLQRDRIGSSNAPGSRGGTL